MPHVDVLILGSGQAGAPLSWRLARTGKQVVLVERGHLGGTCVNEGCTPTKTFIASAEAAHRARVAPALGVETGEVRVDWPRVLARKDAVVDLWRAGVAANVDKAAPNLRLVRGHGRFVGPRAVDVAGEVFTADVVILNTGAPHVAGLERVRFLDSRTVLEVGEVPSHLVVLGGGYIGCEFGQAFARFGSKVTIVQSRGHLLAREDDDVSAALEQAFREEGIELALGAAVTSVEGNDAGVRVLLEDGAAVAGTHLLVATGRAPNTDDLGCDAGGVELDARGNIVVDERFLTSAEGVYAVGDCTGGPQFTHTSWDDHRILYAILHGDLRRSRAGRLVPHATFTDPQVARVGLSEREAHERGVPFEVATLPFGRIARAYETNRTEGLVKILLDPTSERLLGACVVGAEGAELVSVYQMLMAAGTPASAMVDSQMIHPAFAEGLQTTVMRLERYRLS